MPDRRLRAFAAVEQGRNARHGAPAPCHGFGQGLGRIEGQGKLIQAAKSLLLMDFYRITGNYGTRHISAKKRLQAVPRPIRQAAARFLLSLAMWPTEKSERIGSIDAAPFCCKFERAWWSRMSRAAFEDAEFTVPAEYDKILTRIYGDYMTPPPEEKRYGHDSGTGDIIYDANRDYGTYREELLG